jgi:lipoteichoic acid synthase
MFATGPRGVAPAPWIASGSRYDFHLYREGSPNVPLVSITVTRREAFSRGFVVAGVTLIVVIGVMWLLVGRVAKWTRARDLEQTVKSRGRVREWQFELGIALAVALCLWAKLVYADRIMERVANVMEGVPFGVQIVDSASLATVLLLIWPLLLLPRLWRLIPLLVLDLAVSFVLIADELYFRRYIDIITIPDLASAPVLLQRFARPVIVDLLRPIDLVYALDVVVLLLAVPFYVRASRGRAAIPLRLRSRVALCTLAVGLLAAVPMMRVLSVKGIAAGNESYRGEVAWTVGLLPYHFYEAATWLGAASEPPPDLPRIRNFLSERHREAPRSDLFGLAKSRNLVLIQAESLQGFPIGLVVAGQAVTPHLDAFSRESLRFANFFDQTHHGFTSDGEFTTMTSLHPLAEGSASVTLRTNHYRSLPAILAAQGYVTLSACASDKRVWSMDMMHPNHGIELSFFEDRFEDREHFALLSDGELFSQMLNRLAAQPRPFMAFLVTSSSHPPYDLPERYRTLRLPADLDHAMLGDYLQAVHYFDRVFGELVEGLRSQGLLDDTVVAIYGDHQAYLGVPRDITELAGFPDQSPYHQWLVEKRMPLLVRLPQGRHAAALTTPAGHLDIAPTLLGLLGVDDDDRVMLGRDATGGAAPFVVFRDGGFADGDHYYTLPHLLSGRPACYQALSGQPLDCAQLQAGRARALEELAVSDQVLKHDLLPALVRAPIPKTVADVAPPRPYSPKFGVDHVTISGFDVWAPAPSGATFSIENGGGTVRVLFSPIIDEEARAAEPDGVTFEVWSGSSRLYQRHVLPRDLEAAAVDVPPVPGLGHSEISLITRASDGSTHRALATWQRVRFLTGSTARENPASRPNNGR